MCPDRQIISLYCDGELPSPWKEKIEAHFKSCKECRAALDNYNRLGEYLSDAPESSVKAAQERLWKKLKEREPAFIPQESGRWAGGKTKIWNRSVSLPLPAIAAAALVIIAFFALVGIRGLKSPSPEDAVAALMPDYVQLVGDDQGMLPIQDMTGVLQYLSNQDYGDFMVIRLPESRTFSRFGEPALINAADYSRRNAYR
jgi:hypothetical protein